MSLRDRISNWKTRKVEPQDKVDPSFNKRYPAQIQDSQNIDMPYNSMQSQLTRDGASPLIQDNPLQHEYEPNPLQWFHQASVEQLESFIKTASNPVLKDLAHNQYRKLIYEKFADLSSFQLTVEPIVDKDLDLENDEFKAKIKRYKNQREKQTHNTSAVSEGLDPAKVYYKSTGVFAQECNTFDGVSPLLGSPDYNSPISYTYYVNNNVPITKRKRFKKKVKKANLDKVAFTTPSGTWPAFTDLKQPSNQLLSIITNNFNKIEKFIDDNKKITEKISKAIDKLEEDVSSLKKKVK